MLSRMTAPVRRRIVWLLAGNVGLLLVIFACLVPGDTVPGAVSRLGTVLVDTPRNIAPEMLAAIGLTAIIWTGAIDLSIGSVMAVGGAVFAMGYSHGAPPVVCFGGCLLAAGGLVAGNGLLARWLEIPALIVTLAGLAAYRGLALVLVNVGVPGFDGNLTVPEEIFRVPGRDWAGWFLLVAVGGALWCESFGRLPRLWLAHGSSPAACRLQGLDLPRLAISAFLFGGFYLGLGGVLYVSNQQTIDPARMALGFELSVIAAVVLGGTNIFGGEGSFLGTLLGVLFLYLARQTLIYAFDDPHARQAVEGALILGVIGFDCVLHRTEHRMEELK